MHHSIHDYDQREHCRASGPQCDETAVRLGRQYPAGPIPMVGGAQSSNVPVINGAFHIVDAGEGVTHRLTRAGIAIRDIDNIFITHPHADHTGGLGGVTKPSTSTAGPGRTRKALVRLLT
jgi:glyoxylase-like metal-dependent hydrolase (beta-lactamase superfamily II)